MADTRVFSFLFAKKIKYTKKKRKLNHTTECAPNCVCDLSELLPAKNNTTREKKDEKKKIKYKTVIHMDYGAQLSASAACRKFSMCRARSHESSRACPYRLARYPRAHTLFFPSLFLFLTWLDLTWWWWKKKEKRRKTTYYILSSPIYYHHPPKTLAFCSATILLYIIIYSTLFCLIAFCHCSALSLLCAILLILILTTCCSYVYTCDTSREFPFSL